MKKLLIVLVSLVTCHLSLYAAEYRAAIVADLDSGQVLIKENADNINYPASLTKIMTLYLTFDALSRGRLTLDQTLIVSRAAAAAAPVKLGLAAGSKISVDDAMRAVAVYSANDVAVTLAENLVRQDEGDFAAMMTRVAKEIGLSKTEFHNASGLSDDDHVSTARDIALLAMATYKHFPQYWHYFSIKSFTFNGKTYNNGNRLLGAFPGCDGMKTGFTNKSRYSLVATAKRDGRHLISVVLGADNKDVRATESMRLLNTGFEMLRSGKFAMTKSAPQPQVVSAPLDDEDTAFIPATVSVAAPAPRAAAPVVVQKTSTLRQNLAAKATGNAGVQFGAFSTASSAVKQQVLVGKRMGVPTVIENGPGGMFRVRAYNISESDALRISSNCNANGFDCYVFH